MSEIQFTSVDRILAGLNRNLKGTDLNELDVIEWIGEALGFMEVKEAMEESVAFLKVSNHEVDVPDYFKMVLQIARYDKKEEDCNNSLEIQASEEIDLSCPDCCGENVIDTLIGELETPYKPYFDMQWQYIPWTQSKIYKERFIPVRLADNSFFNSVVCQEKIAYQKPCGIDEYTIVGTTEKKLRFSFREGYVALSYVKTAIDPKTGYPLIPDNSRHINAIQYYVKWKLAQALDWAGREGFKNKADDSERLWLRYVKQANNYTKMPKSIDQLQNLLEQTHKLIPRINRYYGYFGNLSRFENRAFSDPDNRTKH